MVSDWVLAVLCMRPAPPAEPFRQLCVVCEGQQAALHHALQPAQLKRFCPARPRTCVATCAITGTHVKRPAFNTALGW